MATILKEGLHDVIIKDVVKTKTKKGIPCVKIIYENEFGFISHFIVLNGNTDIIFKIIFDNVGLDYEMHGKFDLIHKKVRIKVVKEFFINDSGYQKSSYSVKKHFKLPSNESNTTRYYPKDYDDKFDAAGLDEVFGVDKEDIARAMGKSRSEITNSDILEYSGY